MNTIATIGVFDGIHRGHQFLLNELTSRAAALGLQPVVVTFTNSPSAFFCPNRTHKLLTTWEEKKDLLASHGLRPVILNFNANLAQLTAREFLQMLKEKLHVAALLMGFDHSFGSDQLSFEQVKGIGQEIGIRIEQCTAFPEVQVSSTRIRTLISEGKIAQANVLAGHSYTLHGTIVHGYGNGHKLGFPTANLEVDSNKLLPPNGVYIAGCEIDGHSYTGLLNIGRRPTMTPQDLRVSLELHLPDYQGNLYGRQLEVLLLLNLRSEQTFDTPQQLQEQIKNDIQEMKKIFRLFGISVLALTACNQATNNPFFQPYTTRNAVPPFDKIKTEHFEPAFFEGMKQDSLEHLAIATNPEEPTFENTIAALDTCGQMLERVVGVFFHLQNANTNDDLDALAEKISPLLSEHEDQMMLNEALFNRVKKVYNQRESLDLKGEDARLLEETYKDFVRAGANLNAKDKARLSEINKELSALDVKFAKNSMKDAKAYQKWISDEKDLAGLPDAVKQAAKDAATEAGKADQWLFTLDKASFLPVLQYSQNRQLRKDLLLAYTQIANHDNENDNKEVIIRTMQLRVEKAHLMGFNSPAEFILDECMAKTPKGVFDLIMPIWEASLAKAKEERDMLQQIMDQDSVTNFNSDDDRQLKAWDWSYYAEQLRQQQYDLKEEELKPYFELSNVRAGVFGLASSLYGLKFEKLENMPIWHPDVEVFEVRDADNSYIGTLYTDYYPRDGKRAGAWMDNLTPQYIRNGVNHRPVIINIGNLTKPTADQPSLLSMDDVETLFHEFGHALHGLLSQCNYKRLSGTNVPRDFVEMPSQLMENWCWEPAVMRTYAKHYKTGEVMPDSLMQKIQKVGTFNQGFVMTELLSAALLDMHYHCMTTTDKFDVEQFEKATLDSLGLIPEIFVRYRSTYFNHIFTTGYAAGYYSYTWSNVLDTDVFQAFKETGDVLNKEVAARLRHEVLERGDTDEPMTLYQNFRGKAPSQKYLLAKKGLN